MLASCAVALILFSHAAAPMFFLSPGDIINPDSVSVEAQLPQPGMALLAKDPDRPKLWYAPVAAEPLADGARVWYQRVNKDEKEYSDQRTLCVGEIRGGQWSFAPLVPEPPAWGGVNNVCMRRSPHTPTWGGFNVFQMVRTGKEYSMLYWDQPDETGKAGAMLATSVDGLRWDKQPGTVFTEYNDAFTLLPDNGKYLLYQTALEDWPDKPYADNLDKKRRVLTLRRSDDLKTWTPQEVLLKPDAQDPPETEFYLMKAFRYGGRALGLIMKYYADPALPGKHSAILKNELIVSPDGVQWTRPFRDTDLGFWTYADPFLLGDRLHFVIWKDGGMNTVSYAPQRLTAACAGVGEGGFTTGPIAASRPAFTLDADTKDGWLEIALLDGAGNPVKDVPPRRIANTDSEKIPIDFADSPSSGPYRLSVRMCRAKLFAITPVNP